MLNLSSDKNTEPDSSTKISVHISDKYIGTDLDWLNYTDQFKKPTKKRYNKYNHLSKNKPINGPVFKKDIKGFVTKVLPIELDPTKDTLACFIEIVKNFCSSFKNDKKRASILDYYGIYGSKMKTLKEVGEVYGISRERVRQIRNIHLNKLKRLFNGKLSNNMCCDSFLLQQIHQLRDAFYEYKLLNTAMVKDILNKNGITFSVNIFSDERYGHLILFFDVFDIVVDLNTLGHYLCNSQIFRTRPHLTKVKNNIKLTYFNLNKYLKETILPVSLEFLSKELKTSSSTIEMLINISSDIEKTPLGMYQLKDSCISGSDVAYRVLSQLKIDMDYNELLSCVNTLRKSSIASLPMSEDSRFKPVGHSNRWTLADSTINTDCIYELIERAIHRYKRPCTKNEIYNYIKEIRPDISYDSFLGMLTVYSNKKFHKLEDSRIIVDAWKSKYQDQLLNYRIKKHPPYFKDLLIKILKNRALTTRQIVDQMARKSGKRKATCYHFLVSSKLCNKEDEKRGISNVYTLKDNYKEILAEKKILLRDTVKEHIINMFKEKDTLRRKDLVVEIKEKFNTSVPFVYRMLRKDKDFKLKIVDRKNTVVSLSKKEGNNVRTC